MKTEQLIKANEIQRQILKLQNAKQDAERTRKQADKNLYFYATGDGYIQFLSEIIPVSLDNFIEMYILSIEKKIVELEKEFEKL